MVPFDEDDDDNEESGGKGGGKPRDDSGKFKAKSEPEGDDDVDLEEEPDGTVVVRQRDPSTSRPRDEKRGQRYAEMELRNRQAEMERDHYRMMFELQSRAAPQQQSTGPDPEVAKHDAKIADLRKQRSLRYENLVRKGAKASPEERSEAQRELEDIEVQILDAWADRREASRPKQQQQQGNGDERVIAQMMRVEYPEVFQDRRGWQHAQGLANILRSKGESLDLKKTRDILAQAKTFIQNGYQESRPRPTERQKRNYAGRPSGAHAAQEGALSLSPELQKKILLTHKKSGETDAQTLKRWVAKSGKKFQERVRERA